MASLWEDVKNAIVDGYVYAADKAEEVSQIGKAKVEILRLNRKIAHTMSEIGGRVFEFFENGDEAAVPGDKQVQDAVKEIGTIREEIRVLQQSIEDIKAERAKKGAE
jgi:uncharacterized small protein (DUF1192 family)